MVDPSLLVVQVRFFKGRPVFQGTCCFPVHVYTECLWEGLWVFLGHKLIAKFTKGQLDIDIFWIIHCWIQDQLFLVCYKNNLSFIHKIFSPFHL